MVKTRLKKGQNTSDNVFPGTWLSVLAPGKATSGLVGLICLEEARSRLPDVLICLLDQFLVMKITGNLSSTIFRSSCGSLVLATNFFSLKAMMFTFVFFYLRQKFLKTSGCRDNSLGLSINSLGNPTVSCPLQERRWPRELES